ncbi:MAG: hypothetical protein EWV85_09070 [Microcystis aeruginosa Ma_QC_C_20070703_M131]|uniref:Uncharacterized protein n=1 Tax=Microcystis aeruginosa Ma_QC_C_20070703_M131 TaxID=2486263 RepID=A0A551Y3I9_MICAE|nr:MAG: hypothetical protein EWV85_09070 [Microcystis aeruginosa Ma_QC_C_20070703_M131]
MSNAQKTGFSKKPVFYSCTHAKRGINNQSLITRFIVISIKIENINPRVHKGFVGLECIRLI